MTVSTANRVVAPFAAVAIAASTVVAPMALGVAAPDLPTISITASDIDLMADQIFNPSIPLINWADLGFAPLTPIPQILYSALQTPEAILPTISVLSDFLTAIPALPLAWLVGGPDHVLTELAGSIPELSGIASGYDDFAQWTAGMLSGIPLVGQPIQTAFMLTPLLTQWLTASVLNPLPSVFDTSPFWSEVGGFLTGGDGGDVGSAAAGMFGGLDLSSLLGGFDLSALFAEISGMLSGVFDSITGVFDGIADGVGDLLDGIGFLPDGFDFGPADLGALIFAPFDAIGLSAMLGPMIGVAIPMALTAWAGSLLLGWD